MTEDELDRIKKSFVRSSDECPMEVACLLTVMKYYGGQQEQCRTVYNENPYSGMGA